MKKKLIQWSSAIALMALFGICVTQNTFADIGAPYNFDEEEITVNSDGTVTFSDKLKAEFSTNKATTRYIVGDDVCLYKGPNEKYGRIDDGYCLPQGITIRSFIYDGEWIYVEYGGYSGWIYDPIFYTGIAEVEAKNIIVLDTEITLRKKPNTDSAVVATVRIQQFTSLPSMYYVIGSQRSTWYYICINGYMGWYWAGNVDEKFVFAYESDKTLKTMTDTAVYENVDFASQKDTLPTNTQFRVVYYSDILWGDSAYYISYTSQDGQPANGWVKEERNNNIFARANDGSIFIDASQPLYESVNGEKTGEILAPGSYYEYSWTYHDDEHSWRYITSKEGWIMDDTTENEVTVIEEQTKPETAELETEEKVVSDNIKGQIESSLYWMAAGAIVLAASAVVTIILLKKKVQKNPIGEKKDQKKDTESIEKSDFKGAEEKDV